MNSEKMTSLPPVGVSVPLWPWILWDLWKARNKLYFDAHSFTGLEVLQKSIKDAKEWQEAQRHEAKISPPPQPQARNAHIGSEVSLITGPTCHVDAAWNSTSGICGIGGIFSRPIHPPLPIIRSSRRFISSALMAECLAVRSAVMKAASSNIKSLTVFSDSQALVKLLKAKESKPQLFGMMGDI